MKVRGPYYTTSCCNRIIQCYNKNFPLITECSQFIGIPYNFQNNPGVEGGPLANGLDCQRLVHLIYSEIFGVSLPKGMWSKEIYEDNGFLFRSIDLNEERPLLGDIFIFHRRYDDPKKYHLAIFTGMADEHTDPILIHASIHERRVVLWNLHEFFKEGRYKELKVVKRLTPELFTICIGPYV